MSELSLSAAVNEARQHQLAKEPHTAQTRVVPDTQCAGAPTLREAVGNWPLVVSALKFSRPQPPPH